jgi:hypothetical protein
LPPDFQPKKVVFGIMAKSSEARYLRLARLTVRLVVFKIAQEDSLTSRDAIVGLQFRRIRHHHVVCGGATDSDRFRFSLFAAGARRLFACLFLPWKSTIRLSGPALDHAPDPAPTSWWPIHSTGSLGDWSHPFTSSAPVCDISAEARGHAER